MKTFTIETPVHGRFLREDRGAEKLLVGFHGYAETADLHMAELEKIEGAAEWSLVAVQALHPFYTRSGRIVASWMTSSDRELAIADNLTYIRRILETLPRPRSLVFLGFSQGVAMAARAAAYAAQASGLILLGGDIPPELKSDGGMALPPTLLARGAADDWYPEEKFKNDLSFVESVTSATPLVFDGGHEWSGTFRRAAGDFLRAVAEGTLTRPPAL